MQVSLWDVRDHLSSAVARYFLPPAVVLHALALSDAEPHLLAMGGSQRGISVLDLRTLKQLERAHMAKSDNTFVDFLQCDSGQAVAASLDQEVAVSAWQRAKSTVCPCSVTALACRPSAHVHARALLAGHAAALVLASLLTVSQA